MARSPLLLLRLLRGGHYLTYPFGAHPTDGITGVDRGHRWMPHTTAWTSKYRVVHKPPVARVTIAVLVNCKREPQYFPNLDVAKSAAAASAWRGKKGKVVDGDGNYNSSDNTPAQAASRVLPRFFGSSNPAVEAIFKGWTAYRKSNVMWRPNQAMPDGDVTPDGCIHARPAERLSKHRPFLTVGASLPRDPVHPPAAEHVDQKEFPALEQSPYMGIGGIKGYNEVPKATTQGEPAFLRPVDGQAAPRPKEGTLGIVTTTTAMPTTSAADYASAASPLNGRQHQQAMVRVDRMSDAQKAAQKAIPPKEAGSASTLSASTSKPKLPEVEAMDTDADTSTQKVTSNKKGGEVTTPQRSGRSASDSRVQKDTSSSRTGKTAPTPTGSKSQVAKSGMDKVQQALKKAGGLEQPRPDLGPITKRPDDKGKRAIDYRQEAFPAPTLRVVQPGGRHLKEAPVKPQKVWVANTKATQAEVMVHLRALAQGGRQHAEYRDHSHWLRDWDDKLQQLKSSQEAMKRLQEEETLVDETHAGTVLATIYALQKKRDELLEEVAKLKAHRTFRHKQLREARKEVENEKARADAAEKRLQDVEDALQKAVRERDEARAAQPQAPAGPLQPLPDQGAQQLREELAAAKQELEQLCARMSASAPAAEVAQLQSHLQEAQAALTAQQGAVPESDLQTRVTALEQECWKAQGRVQELLDEGQTLQNQYQELQAQKAAMEVQLNGQLKVAKMEIDGLEKKGCARVWILREAEQRDNSP